MEASQVFTAGWMDKENMIYTYSRWLYSAFFYVDHFFLTSLLNLLQYCFCLMFCLFLDLSSLTRDQICFERRSLNHLDCQGRLINKEGNPDVNDNMNTPWGCYAKLNKPVTKGQILDDSTYTRYVRRSYSQEKQVVGGCQELGAGRMENYCLLGTGF